jgi:hypothetical protein
MKFRLRCEVTSDSPPNARNYRRSFSGDRTELVPRTRQRGAKSQSGTSAVVQAKAWGVVSRFGLPSSATNDVVEVLGVDFCPFCEQVLFLAAFHFDSALEKEALGMVSRMGQTA